MEEKKKPSNYYAKTGKSKTDSRAIATRKGVPWVNGFHPISALDKTVNSDCWTKNSEKRERARARLQCKTATPLLKHETELCVDTLAPGGAAN